MTAEQLAVLETVGAALKHVGAAMAESHTHARYTGSPDPLGPLAACLNVELPALRRDGHGGLAAALSALWEEVSNG